VAWLKELPSEQFAGVVSTFKPGAGTRDMTARLKAFAQSRSTQPQITNNIKQFVAKWGLDDRSEELLRSLESNVLDIVLREFEPPHGTINNDKKLASFARYASYHASKSPANVMPTSGERSNGSKSVPIGAPSVALQKQRASGTTAMVGAESSPEPEELINKWGLKEVAVQEQRWVPKISNGSNVASATTAMAGAESSPEPEELIKKWGLNEVAVQALSRLPRSVQTEALAEFDPPGDMTNISGVFIAFLRRRSASAGTFFL